MWIRCQVNKTKLGGRKGWIHLWNGKSVTAVGTQDITAGTVYYIYVYCVHLYILYKAGALCVWMFVCVYMAASIAVTGGGGSSGGGTRLIWTVGFCLSANKIWLPSVWITRNFELIRDTSIIIGPYNPFRTLIFYATHPQCIRIFFYFHIIWYPTIHYKYKITWSCFSHYECDMHKMCIYIYLFIKVCAVYGIRLYLDFITSHVRK